MPDTAVIAAADRLRTMGELQADIADLKAERKACFCARAGEYDWNEEPDADRPVKLADPEQEKPCWKNYREVPAKAPAWATEPPEPHFLLDDPGQWCDSCRRRQEIHEELTTKTRRLAAMRAALTRAARRERADG